MAQPQERQSQAERRNRSEDALLDAAAELVAERGVQGTSLASIGGRAGVSRGLPTHHFGSKDALVARLAERAQSRIGQEMLEAQRSQAERIGDLSALDEVFLTVDAYLEMFEDPTPDQRALLVMWGSTFSSGASVDGMADAERRSYEGLSQLIISGQQDGSVRADVDPIATAVLLHGLMRGLAALRLTDSGLTDMRGVRSACQRVDLLVAGAEVRQLRTRSRSPRPDGPTNRRMPAAWVDDLGGGDLSPGCLVAVFRLWRALREGGSTLMRVRRGHARWLMVLASLGVAVSLFATLAGTASGASGGGRLEVNVMNEVVRGGEPELAINPKNPQNIVMGHTVVGNTYTKNTIADTIAAVPGGLQVSFNGGKTWSADNRPLHTSGYSEGPNPYSIAHGFPGATGFTLTTNGAGDPIEASGPDGSIYAGGVFVHSASPGPPPFNFTVPQGGIAVFRSTNGGRSFGPLSAVLTDQDLQGMVNRGMNPQPIGAFGVNPYDRPWMVVDQTHRCRLRIDHRSS